MDPAEIEEKIEQCLDIPLLKIQVDWQDEDLVIVFNRPSSEHLNYKEITKKTIDKLRSLKLPPPKQITFYSRLLGEETPDWQTTINIVPPKERKPTADVPESKTPVSEAPPSIPEPTSNLTETALKPESINPLTEPSLTSEPTSTLTELASKSESINPLTEPSLASEPTSTPTQPKLSDFCFIRNKALVKADLPPPNPKVAENVQFFHQLDEKIQLELAPILEDFFKNPDKTSLISVPVELRSWFENLKKLADDDFRSQGIWLSRYCYNPEQTMTTINHLFDSLKEVQKATQANSNPTPQPVQRQSQTPKQSVNYRSSSSKNSQKFTPDELIFMIGGGLLVAGIGWFLWGTAAFFSIFGWVAGIMGVVSGVGTILGNQTLKTISGILLLIIYIIFSGIGFIILWIEFLGWLTGLIVAGAVTSMAQSSGAESITSPKPLRILVALTLVILIGMGYAALKPPYEKVQEVVAPGSTGTPLDTVEVLITNNEIKMSNSALKPNFIMKVENKASKTCKLDFESNGSYGVTYSPSNIVESGKSQSINVNISPGIFQLNCERDFDEPDFLEVYGPTFTVKSD